MSQFSVPPTAGRGVPVPPRGEEVASFATYPEAQHAVDSLSDDGFPVQVLMIVGTDLRQVERITGRMSWGRAVASGAMSGLWLGIFFGAVLSILSPSTGSGAGLNMLTCVLLGILWGILFQVIAYAMTRGRRDFTSISQVVASRYSILAAERATEAAQALAQLSGNLTRGGEAARRAEDRRRARAQARGEAPTTFGSRPDEQPRFGARLPEGMDPLAFAAGSAAPAEVVVGGSAGEPAAPSGSGRDAGPDGGGEDESSTGVGHRGPGGGHGSGHGGGEA